MADQQKNVHADLGSAFTADAMTVVFGQGRFVLDFKKTAPRVDHVGGDERQTLVMEHSPVIMQPEAAKALVNLLQQNIEEYEDRFGEIELPEAGGGDDDGGEPEQAVTQEHSYIG